jgi:protein-tyrosine phosphatase
VNVLETASDTPRDAWVPILVDLETEDGVETRASPRMLDEASDTIAKALKRGRKVFVHCGAGLERSPLAVAWYLWRSGAATSLEAAYVTVLQKRPAARQHADWVFWDEPS